MGTLYDINKQILECIDFETGEILDDEKLEKLELEKNEKLENVALWVKNLNADIEAYKNERKSFDEKIKSATNKAESLKNYLALNLKGAKFKTEKVQISFRKSERVEITNDLELPAEFKKVKEIIEIDKIAIKSAIKNGEIVDGATVSENLNIQIK